MGGGGGCQSCVCRAGRSVVGRSASCAFLPACLLHTPHVVPCSNHHTHAPQQQQGRRWCRGRRRSCSRTPRRACTPSPSSRSAPIYLPVSQSVNPWMGVTGGNPPIHPVSQSINPVNPCIGVTRGDPPITLGPLCAFPSRGLPVPVQPTHSSIHSFIHSFIDWLIAGPVRVGLFPGRRVPAGRLRGASFSFPSPPALCLS